MDLIKYARLHHPPSYGAGNGWSQLFFDEFANAFLQKYNPAKADNLIHLTVRPATERVKDASMTVAEQATYPSFLYWETRYVTWNEDAETHRGYIEYELKVISESIPPEMLVEFARDFPRFVVHTIRQEIPAGERIIYDWQASEDAQLHNTCYLFESAALEKARTYLQEMLAVFPDDLHQEILRVRSKVGEIVSV